MPLHNVIGLHPVVIEIVFTGQDREVLLITRPGPLPSNTKPANPSKTQSREKDSQVRRTVVKLVLLEENELSSVNILLYVYFFYRYRF